MRKNAVLFGCLTALAFVIVGILELISSIKGFNQLGSGSGDVYSFARGALTFELIASVILLGASSISLAIISKNRNDKPIYASTLSILSLFTLSSIIDTFVAFELAKKMMGPYSGDISMPGVGIAKLIFLFLALALFGVGFFLLKSYYHDDKAGGVAAAGAACLIICCIFAFASMDGNSDGLIITATIFLLIGCLLAATEYINSYGSSGFRPRIHYNTSSNYAQPSQSYNSSSKNGAADELRKLKELYDDGVITSEEYNEKRKKYIDEL